MHSFVLARYFLLFLFCAFLQPLILVAQNGNPIIEIKAYEFPPYEEAEQTTDIELYTDKEEYRDVVNDSDYEFKKIHYVSEGLKVVCYLYRPTMLENKTYPAIIFNRGSYIRGDIAPELIPMFHRLAENGFVVLAPMYRGSDGGEGRDEMGGRDLNDLLNVPKIASELGFIDMGNLFLYGESRGGMMVLQALREKFPASAAATFGTFTDLKSLLNSDPERYNPMTEQIWPDYKSNKEEILRRRSAIRWADSIGIPLLVMHGGNDNTVNPEQALSFARKLQELGKKYELVIYAGDNHILSKHAKARDQRVIQWFRGHLQDTTGKTKR